MWTVIVRNHCATYFLMKFRELRDGLEHAVLSELETALFLSVVQTPSFYPGNSQRNFQEDMYHSESDPLCTEKLPRMEISLTDYIIWGGFPKRIEYSSESAQRIYLNELNETIILNDIINRYRIRKTEVFKRLANFIFLSNSRTLSSRSVERYMRGAGLPSSITTITKYIGYLEEAYAIGTIKRYSEKAKHELEYYLKVYNEDVALNSIRVMNNRYDLTHNFENVIYNELIYMGYSLQVYHDGSHEIDFVARKGNKQYYIQVAYSVAEEKTYEREFGAFAKLDNSCQKIIITNDDIDFSTSTVRHIQFRDFVEMDEL